MQPHAASTRRRMQAHAAMIALKGRCAVTHRTISLKPSRRARWRSTAWSWSAVVWCQYDKMGAREHYNRRVSSCSSNRGCRSCDPAAASPTPTRTLTKPILTKQLPARRTVEEGPLWHAQHACGAVVAVEHEHLAHVNKHGWCLATSGKELQANGKWQMAAPPAPPIPPPHLIVRSRLQHAPGAGVRDRARVAPQHRQQVVCCHVGAPVIDDNAVIHIGAICGCVLCVVCVVCCVLGVTGTAALFKSPLQAAKYHPAPS